MANLELILEAERRGLPIPEPKRVLLEEARRRGLVPGGAQSVAAPPAQQMIGGGAQASYPTPADEVPIVPERGIPELRQANEQWQINAHNLARETLPMVGLGLGSAAGTSFGPAGTVAGGAGGYAAGVKGAEGVDAEIGYRPLRQGPQTGTEAALSTAKDLGVGALYGSGEFLALAPAKVSEWATRRSAMALDSIVKNGIQKGVRPTVVGKRTWAQRVQAMKRAGEAVRTIIGNKQNLQFQDEFGEIVTGRLPRTLDEFSSAIDQTKRTIFQQYDDMAGNGGVVDMGKIANELVSVSGRKELVAEAPGAVKYAADKAATYANQGMITAREAQDQLAVINSRLDAFYKRGTGTYDQAYIDSLAADRLRQALDDAITKTSGPGYQALKNQYGALKSVEREVNHRAIVANRQNVRSLTDFISDLSAMGHTASALAKGDPAGVGVGMAVKAVGKLTKRANDPNRIIEKMFADADALITKQAARNQSAQTPGMMQRFADARGVPRREPPDELAAQGAGPSPYDTPTFQRFGRKLSDRDMADDMAQGHIGYYEPSPAEQSARVFRATLPQTPAVESAAVFEKTAQGHRPVLVPEYPLPMPKSAAESARVFESMPSQTPAADRAGAFIGPNEMIRRSPAGMSATVFENISMQNKTPQAAEALRARLLDAQSRGAIPSPVGAGGLARSGNVKPKVALAPKWVKQEVKAMLPADTPEWLVAEYVNAAMGRR